MATLVAIVVLIRNCHQRADVENTEIINGISTTKETINHSGDKQGIQKNWRWNHSYKYNKQKPISSKMAYALLQEIKKLNPRQKAAILGQFNITEAKLQKDLSPIAREKSHSQIVLPANFDPNDFDSSQWIQKLRLQPWKFKYILRYQSKLGGFYSLEQLREIPQLDSMWKAKILEPLLVQQTEKQEFSVKKLDKNASWKQWYQHPYVGDALAKILKPFYDARKCVTKDDLLTIKEISQQQMQRLLPYLSIDCKD